MLKSVVTHHVSKVVKGKKVLNRVSINVKQGEIYSLVGATGSGKTCLLRVILGLARQDEGDVFVLGDKNQKFRNKTLKRTGIFMQKQQFYTELTALQNLNVYARVFGLYKSHASEEVLELLSLSPFKHVKVKDLSLTQYQRLGIARALLNHPDLLILDEPMDELDPLAIRDIRELFIKLNREKGVTILLTSINLSEIDQFSDTIGILHEGSLLEEIDYKDLRKKIKKANILKVDQTAEALRILETDLDCFDYEVVQNEEIQIYQQNLALHQVIEALVQKGIQIQMAYPKEESLESYFITLTGGAKHA